MAAPVRPSCRARTRAAQGTETRNHRRTRTTSDSPELNAKVAGHHPLSFCPPARPARHIVAVRCRPNLSDAAAEIDRAAAKRRLLQRLRGPRRAEKKAAKQCCVVRTVWLQLVQVAMDALVTERQFLSFLPRARVSRIGRARQISSRCTLEMQCS